MSSDILLGMMRLVLNCKMRIFMGHCEDDMLFKSISGWNGKKSIYVQFFFVLGATGSMVLASSWSAPAADQVN